MKQSTLDLVNAEAAFDDAESAFQAVKKVWIGRGRPPHFPSLDVTAALYADALQRFRKAIDAAAKKFPEAEDVQ